MLPLLAQSSSSDGASTGVSVVVLLIYAAIFVAVFVGYWKVFTKIGLPGWMGIVPFVNVYMLFKARGQREPVLWLILALIPCVNIVAMWFLASDTAELFGKDVGWKVFLFLIPGVSHLILGYGSSEVDPSAVNPAIRPNSFTPPPGA